MVLTAQHPASFFSILLSSQRGTPTPLFCRSKATVPTPLNMRESLLREASSNYTHIPLHYQSTYFTSSFTDRASTRSQANRTGNDCLPTDLMRPCKGLLMLSGMPQRYQVLVERDGSPQRHNSGQRSKTWSIAYMLRMSSHFAK